MEKQNNVPKLRFPEFSDSWGKKKFEDFTILSAFGPRFSSDLYSSSGNVVTLRTTDMDEDGIIDYTNAPKAIVDIEQLKEHILLEDDVIISRSGTIGITGVYKKYELPVIPGAFLIRFRLDLTKVSPKFIQLFLNGKKGRNQLEALSAGGVQKNLTGTSVLGMTLNLPILPEQQKIATFLSTVDEKIQALKKKKSLLETYKKGVMQKLFSQEIRFKDDEGNDYEDWEVKKLGEISVFSKGKNISKADIVENGITECIRYGELYTHYRETINQIKSRTNISLDNLVLSEANDIIIPASGETQIDIATASCVLKSGVALGGDLNIIKTKQNGVFMSYYLNNAQKQQIASLAQGISVVHLYSSQLALLEIQLPSLPEQTTIANFLTAIDEKINKVDAQIKQTELWKKGLLQQMFV